MKASDLFIRALENEGVEYIFGVPGEENLDFLNSLKDSESIKLILTRHEQAAGFMAATYGRLTGKTGVCLSTLGPGATNFVTAAAYAQLGGMPILMISGQKPIKKSKQGQFQIVDIVEMMRPLTKMARQIVNGGTIPSLVREAIRVSEEERPGAVYLELPEDIAREDVEAHLFTPSESRRPTASRITIQEAAKKISSATMPLVLIGAAANRNRTCRAMAPFLDKTGLYFFDTQMGMGVSDERRSKFLGTAALSAKDYLHCAIDRADLILNIGHDVIEKPPFFMEKGGKEVIHMNFLTAKVDEVYFPQLEVVGDIATSVEMLTEELEASSHWDFSYYERVRESINEHIHSKDEVNSFPVIPQRIVADVRKAMPSDGIVTLDNGIYKVWFARNYTTHDPNTLLLDNALATMGAGLPSAMGAKIVRPDKKVLSVCGDGGFMMNSQELETAVRLKLDLVVLILRDNAYGMIKWKQASMGFENWGLDYGNPDFVKYAESYGARGLRISDTNEFLPTLKEALDSSGLTVIELPVDYSENERVLLDELEQKTCLL
ncbi:MAG: acetolactate synthase large subunit [Verrucomicrobia bacterium]|nr:acetolactate synthase large subunit [Verrucomicrobiota bacterium]